MRDGSAWWETFRIDATTNTDLGAELHLDAPAPARTARALLVGPDRTAPRRTATPCLPRAHAVYRFAALT